MALSLGARSSVVEYYKAANDLSTEHEKSISSDLG
jgi:hypothetical protein